MSVRDWQMYRFIDIYICVAMPCHAMPCHCQCPYPMRLAVSLAYTHLKSIAKLVRCSTKCQIPPRNISNFLRCHADLCKECCLFMRARLLCDAQNIYDKYSNAFEFDFYFLFFIFIHFLSLDCNRIYSLWCVVQFAAHSPGVGIFITHTHTRACARA